MDALAHLLDGPRGRGAILLQLLMTAPWSLSLEDDAPIGLITVLRGHAWLTPEDADSVLLPKGGVVVTKGQDPVSLADQPDTKPQVIVGPGWECATPSGADVGRAWDLGVRTWGNDPHGSTALLVACYQVRGEISQRVLDALPQSFLLAPGTWNDALVAILATEIGSDAPGQRPVLDRLFDLLLISVIREWFTRPEADVPTWYLATTDPLVGAALRLLHDRPAEPWTVARLAAETGVSRSVLAHKFADRVGVPPMTYLKEWRLSLAADLMIESDHGLDAIARRVGYSDGFALSRCSNAPGASARSSTEPGWSTPDGTAIVLPFRGSCSVIDVSTSADELSNRSTVVAEGGRSVPVVATASSVMPNPPIADARPDVGILRPYLHAAPRRWRRRRPPCCWPPSSAPHRTSPSPSSKRSSPRPDWPRSRG